VATLPFNILKGVKMQATDLMTVTDVAKAQAAGNVQFHFFYGGTFSQWHSSPFEDEAGVHYATAEHYMMYHKARVFGDEAAMAMIANSTDPSYAKRMGRKVAGFDPHVWDEHKIDIVLKGSMLKYASNERLKNILLDTGDTVLVEASPYDKIWGIGLAEGATDSYDATRWRGQNLLGFCLMEARNRLAAHNVNEGVRG